MIRGALGSRYGISGALGRSIKREAAGGWWLSGGISAANCIAAYQPKGAASLAASKVNLATPGTNDAVAGTNPTFDASYGWSFNNSWLQAGTIILTSAYSMIVRFTDWSGYGASGAIIGMRQSNSVRSAIYRTLTTHVQFVNNNILSVTNSLTSGVLCLAGVTSYIDGVSTGLTNAGYSDTVTKYVRMGWWEDIATGVVKIQAVGIYNVTLTAPQVAALSTAMAAL